MSSGIGGEAWRAVIAWPARRRLVAAAWAFGTILLIGVPTAMIPTPYFGREIATTWWAWPVLVATAMAGGLLGATYIRSDEQDRTSSSGVAGGVLAYVAVGCPVCNKLALLALGYAGALQWFAPVQPWLGVLGLGLLVVGLDRRLRGEIACPTRPAAVPAAVRVEG